MFQGMGGLIGSGIAFDENARLFIDAAGITDATEKSAINTLVKSAKTNGWWTKCDAIYPMVGSTSTTCSFNLKNVLLYKITFNGGWTYNSSGAKPDGIAGTYAQTGLVPALVLTKYDTHMSYYSNTNSAQASSFNVDMGAIDSTGGGAWLMGLVIRRGTQSDASWSCQYENATSSALTARFDSDTDSLGFYLGARNSSTTHYIYKNSTLKATDTHTNTGELPRTTGEITLAALNLYLNSTMSDRRCAFATVGSYIDATLEATMYNDIQTFQTTLGRNV